MFSAAKTSAPVSGAFSLTKSLRFRASASAYFNRTPSTASNQTTWTWSGWVKLGSPQSATIFFFGASSGSNTNEVAFGFSSTGQLQNILGTVYSFKTNPIFVDPSAWYHIVLATDTTQATSSNRQKLYVNGVQITSFASTNYPSQNATYAVNSAVVHSLGRFQGSSTGYYFDGELCDVYLIDGQALTPSSFGSTNATTGQWSPAKYTGTYGTNGFHLTFANTTSTTTLGYDTSGNSNNWTTNNISLTAGSTYDSMNDVPVAYSASASNYCVLNSNDLAGSGTLSNGNLTYATSLSTFDPIRASFGVSSGKWYWEVTCVSQSGASANAFMIGISSTTLALTASTYIGSDATSYGYYGTNGNKYNNGSSVAYGSTYTTGDVIGVAFDADVGTLTFYKNNTSQGTAFSGLSGTFVPAYSDAASSGTTSISINFGQQPFTYTPPSGYNALNTYNLPTPAIAQGNKYMDATLYTGNSSTQSITNAGGFKPDLVWGKDRTSALNNRLFDAVRGVSKALYSNNTTAETTESGVTAFNSNGFTLGSDQGLNFASDSYVAWQWQAGAGSSSSNTNGSITSTVSVSTTAGFSVVTWTYNGSGTIGHGLSAVPQMIIQKDRTSGTYNWDVYHVSLGNTKRAILNSSAVPDVENVWNNTTPTSSVFSIGSSWYTNGDNVVSYCFAPVAGFSAFGTYSGNSSNQFIYTGFQPKWVMVRLSGPSGGGSWTVFDTSRSPYNLETLRLQPNSSNAEASTGSNGINGLSNGFQLVGDYNGGDTNLSGYTYIYAAFASNPFAYSNAF